MGSGKDKEILKMTLEHFVLFGLLAFIAAAVVQSLISFGHFEHVYNHRPGRCVQFHMNGSEDMALLPNDHVLISSGNCFWEDEGKVVPGIYMLDLNNPTQGPKQLLLEGGFPERTQDFVPHGIGHWVMENGSVILYVINHRRGRDFVESFYYDTERLCLRHRKSFSHPLLRELNDLVLVALDEFYTSNSHYFDVEILKTVERYLRLPWTTVTYYSDVTHEAKSVAWGLRFANGIAMSNNGREKGETTSYHRFNSLGSLTVCSFIYVSNMLQGEVNAFTINWDNSLQLVQSLPVQIATDNIFVSPTNGHLWVSLLPKPLQLKPYEYSHSNPLASRVIHVTIDETSELPFSKYQLEEVFASTGHDIRAISIGVYHKKKLLLGSICTGMTYCEVPLLMYE